MRKTSTGSKGSNSRLEEVGLLEHKQVKDAIATIEASGQSEELQNPEYFASAVFLEITGSQAVTNCIVNNLFHNPSVTEFTFGDKGIIFNRHFGQGGLSDVLGVYFYGNEEHGNCEGAAIAKVANAPKNLLEEERFEIDKRIMALHSNVCETEEAGCKTVLPKYYNETGKVSLKNTKSGVVESRNYYAMELLKGHSLQDILEEILDEEGQHLDPQIAIDLLVAVLIKLKNYKGDIHRNIKPDHIFVQDDGTIRLLGCSISKEGYDADKGRVTQPIYSVMGTPCYMVPEHLSGGVKGERMFASDTYSLASSLYELLHRELPFDNDGEGFMGYYHAHMSGAKPSFSVVSTGSGSDIKNHPAEGSDVGDLTVLDEANPKLANALRTMLSIKPEDRLAPKSVQDLFMAEDPNFKDGRKTFDPTNQQAKDQFKKWIEELLPSSSFTTDDIKDGNPSIFKSIFVPKPEYRELKPELQIGSELTRKEMYRLLTTPTSKSVE